MRRPAQKLVILSLAAAALAPAAAFAKPTKRKVTGPVPSVRLTLTELGVQGLSDRFLQLGASMFSVNLIDNQHLLLTFAAKSLVRRDEKSTKDSDDRNVAGEIVELPSGKVLAKTEWVMHDHARYLWPLGRGRFVLRIGNDLALLDPAPRLARNEDPFVRVSLGPPQGVPIGVTASPDAHIFSIIRQLPPADQKGPVVMLGANTDNRARPEYLINFLRFTPDGSMKPAGAARAPFPLALPLDEDGYLWADEGNQRGHWQMSFNSFTSTRPMNIGSIESVCPPKMRLLSRSEYLLIGCRGLTDTPRVLVSGMDGHETWEEDFPAFAETPAFAHAPDAGRFAMSFITETPTSAPGDLLATSTPNTTAPKPAGTQNQELRVYQSDSGDLLLKLAVTPVFHTPENFDISADGRTFVAVAGTELLIYDLAAPSAKDLADLKEVEAFAPPSTGDARVTLHRLENAPAEAVASVSSPTSTTTQAAAAVPSAAAAEAGTLGDAVVPGLRKRPTLLNPGETPEYKDKTAQPK